MFIQFERPLRAEERAELQAAGVVFHETLAPFTYLALVPASAAGALANHPLFRGLEPIVAADKVAGHAFPRRRRRSTRCAPVARWRCSSVFTRT